jgi:hypothetical protein
MQSQNTNTHHIAQASCIVFLRCKYKTNGIIPFLRMDDRMSRTTDPTTPQCAGSCQLRSRHRVLRRPYRSGHGMTLERPRTDTTMSNTGEITSQAAAQRRAFSTNKSFLYAVSVGKVVHIRSIDWFGIQATIVGNKISRCKENNDWNMV